MTFSCPERANTLERALKRLKRAPREPLKSETWESTSETVVNLTCCGFWRSTSRFWNAWKRYQREFCDNLPSTAPTMTILSRASKLHVLPSWTSTYCFLAFASTHEVGVKWTTIPTRSTSFTEAASSGTISGKSVGSSARVFSCSMARSLPCFWMVIWPLYVIFAHSTIT